MANDELAVISVDFKIKNFDGTVVIKSYIDGDVRNEDANYDEFIWEELELMQIENHSVLSMQTKKTGFVVTTGQSLSVIRNGKNIKGRTFQNKNHQVGSEYALTLKDGQSFSLEKYVSVISSLMHAPSEHINITNKNLKYAGSKGVEKLKAAHSKTWKEKWDWSDVVIEGDVAAQQGIRFNIFQLNQTYTGEDDRLNIGPKGFTGEKYGGSTYWDTEAYCLPYYLSTADSHVGKNLVKYRYNHLQKAIENAEKLGFKNGAALYPMVTMNGEECHNEWEITFEEIHRNGAIAHGVYDYVNYTGDSGYL
jgi:maltose phosphorylase